MTLIATKSMRYGGRGLEAGDPFEPASDRHARILKAIGKASEPSGQIAHTAAATPPAPAPKARKGYKRRDMTAEAAR